MCTNGPPVKLFKAHKYMTAWQMLNRKHVISLQQKKLVQEKRTKRQQQNREQYKKNQPELQSKALENYHDKQSVKKTSRPDFKPVVRPAIEAKQFRVLFPELQETDTEVKE